MWRRHDFGDGETAVLAEKLFLTVSKSLVPIPKGDPCYYVVVFGARLERLEHTLEAGKRRAEALAKRRLTDALQALERLTAPTPMERPQITFRHLTASTSAGAKRAARKHAKEVLGCEPHREEWKFWKSGREGEYLTVTASRETDRGHLVLCCRHGQFSFAFCPEGMDIE